MVIETQDTGRTARTARYKYVDYADDPVKQLFDMQEDPLETKNLYGDSKYDSIVANHQERLKEWESGLEPAAKA